MRKHLAVIKAFWQRTLIYRFTVFAYRIGEIGELLVLIVMWTAIFGEQDTIRGFTLREMVTYVLVGNFFHAIVRNFLAEVVARDIKEGQLSMFLVRPMGYFSYILSREVGRVALATFLSALSQIAVILFFLNTFIFNFSAPYLLLITTMIIFAFITELLLSYLIGLIAFWTEEIEGLYATVDRIKKFFSGGYFPLTLLPALFVKISFFLPFAYSFFVPAQLYLKKIDVAMGIQGLFIQIAWITVLYLAIKLVWKLGLKKYESVGI